jgi:replicative DNA helicase
MDTEWSLLSKTVEVRGFQALAQARITQSFFMDPDNAAVYGWMLDHWTRYGESPGEEAFHHEYPADNLIETPEPLAYYIDELREAYRYGRLTGVMDSARDALKNHDTGIATKLLATGLEALQIEVVDLQDDALTETMEQRVAYYDNLSTQRGLLGLPTGFPTMDRATNGLQKGQLVTLTGLQKKKKSMLLMCMSIAAHRAGGRTMFASFEMSNTEQATRHDALRSGISLNRLQAGKHTPDERQKLIRMMHELDGMQPLTLIYDPAGTTTVSAIAAKISQHRPDVVFIDGTYMMDAEGVNAEPGSPQALTSITRSLKRLAQRVEIPIVQTTQSLTWKAKRGLTLDSIGYSSSFAQDSDVIFGVEEIKEDGEVNDHEMMLRIIASRNCPRTDVRLAVDLDRGTIIETEEIAKSYEADDKFD